MKTLFAVIPVTAVLYNIAKYMHEPQPPVPYELGEEEFNYLIQMAQIPEVPINNNLMFQTDSVNDYFSSL